MSLLARTLPLALIAAALLAGCGSDGSSETSAPAQSGSETTQGHESGSGSGPVGIGANARSCGAGDGYKLLLVTGVDCGTGSRVAAAWVGNANCRPPKGQTRSACSVDEYRCLATTITRGISVSCARPQRAISFIAKP